MARDAKRCRTDVLSASNGTGDAETEFALENELREEIEGQWYEGEFTSRDHLPSSECSQETVDSLATDVIMAETGWPFMDIDELPEYKLALADYYDEELHLSMVE